MDILSSKTKQEFHYLGQAVARTAHNALPLVVTLNTTGVGERAIVPALIATIVTGSQLGEVAVRVGIASTGALNDIKERVMASYTP